MSLTISTTINGTLSLAPTDNPVTIEAGGAVNATATGADAIDGGSGVSWTISNAGTVSSTFGYGVNLAGLGSSVSNDGSGSISGVGGVALSDDGSVINNGTITATGTTPSPLATISGIYVTGPSNTDQSAISVTNFGVVQAANGYGIGLGASGTVDNSGQVTGGEDGIVVLAGVGNIQNSGTVVATLDDGIGLFGGGAVTNAAGASISGSATSGAGIFVIGGLATISNSGGVSGHAFGILAAAGGTITNNLTGNITGQTAGVALSNGGELDNYGSISATGTNEAGADLELGGNVNNYAGATLSGTADGAFITGAQGAVVNWGTISGGAYDGVSIGDGGSVQNNTTGSIIGITAGVNLTNQSATVVNDGSISATGSGGAAIQIGAGGSVTNDSGATLSAADYAVFASGVAAAVTNAGMATGIYAIGFEAGGTITNLSGGTLSGQTAGIFDAGGAGAVDNSGSITASVSGGAGLDLESAGSSVTNNAGGTISGSAYGVFMTGGSGVVSDAANASISSVGIGVFMGGGSNSLTNDGTIISTGSAGVDAEGAGDVVTNASGATISGSSGGVYIAGPGTVINLGSISGGSSYAVNFGGGPNSANLLQVGAGATFTGSVNGDGGAIELLTGSGAIGGIGNSGQFYGFQSLNVDAGADWALNGSANSIANVTDNGILTVAGSLDVATAVNAGSIGAFDLGAGGALELASATGSQTAVDFLGASQLTIDNAALFGTGVGGTSYLGSQLENFGAADSIDIHNFSAQRATFAYNPTSGLLQISNGSELATLDFQQSTLGGGSFQLAGDASGSGLLITVDAQAPSAPTLSDAAIVNGYVNAASDTAGQTLGGTAQAGSTVNVYLNGAASPAFTTVADGSGNWSMTLGHLADGSYSYTATATDAAGNVSVAGGPLTFTVDTQAPSAPTLSDAAIVNGYVNAANDTAGQTLGGTAQAGSTINVYLNGAASPAFTTVADGSGNWSVTLGPLVDGSYSYTATATDAAGNVSVAGGPLAFTVDTTPPAQPAITAASLSGGAWKLTGTAAAGSTVTVYDGATKLGTATASSTGAWSFLTHENNSAIRDYSTTATDPAGNTSIASAAWFEGTPGNDMFLFASEVALAAPAAIFGNGGSDTIDITAPATLADADFAHAHNILTLALTSASTVTLGANAATAGIGTVTTGNGATSIADSNTGTLKVNASALAPGATLNLSGSEKFTVTGLQGNLVATNMTGALNVTTAATSALSIATGGGPDTINASAMTQGETLTLTGSHAATVTVGGNLAAGAYTGNLTVTASGTAPHTITTGGGKDSITAANGGDTIAAGGGADTINVSGHAIADSFVYKSVSDSPNTAAGHDTITGFLAGAINDALDFSALLGPTYSVQALGSTSTKVNPHSIAWIYNSSTLVYVNATGAALSQTSNQLMEVALAGNLHLTAANLIG